MSQRRLLIGESSFAALRECGACYVDKTAFIPSIWNDGSVVSFITRPRRFGKTLFQNTLRSFFELNYDDLADRKAALALFSGLDVMSDSAFCEANLGRWPVLLVSFKDVGGTSAEDVTASLARVVADVAQEYAFLAESEHLSDFQRRNVEELLWLQDASPRQRQNGIAGGLKALVKALQAHCDKDVIVLLDEYDVPLNLARAGGFYEELAPLMSEMLGGVLKDNEALRKAVVTGCLPPASDRVFAEMNHWVCHSVADDELAAVAGFTQKEVARLLADFGLLDFAEGVERRYGAYRFGKTLISCPWDLLSFCRDAQGRSEARFKDYWIETSGNRLVEEFLHRAGEAEMKLLKELLAGHAAKVELDKGPASVVDRSLWRELCSTGYLTADGAWSDGVMRIRFPNEAVRACFERQVKAYFSAEGSDFRCLGQQLVQMLVDGEGAAARDLLQTFLTKWLSARGAAPEGFYHQLMLGLLETGDCMVLESRSAAKDDSSSIRLVDPKCVVVMLELKRSPDEELLPAAAAKALAQIEDKRTGAQYAAAGARLIRRYGLAFAGTKCFAVQGEAWSQDSPNV